jgi:hypothetical protein
MTGPLVVGNGGDLMSGLPLQSLQIDDEHPVHRPLRLLAIIQAPIERVDAILDRHASLVQLLDHEWIHLTIMDPTQDNAFFHYGPDGWTAHTNTTSSAPARSGQAS